MISWLKLKDYWIFTFHGQPIDCKDLREVVVCSIEAGLNWKEMKIACDQMDLNDHNLAEFGIQKRFTFSARVLK